jgi:type VI secretion system protein ImpK
MKRNTAELVDPIFNLTWTLRESLQHADATIVAEAQSELKQLISQLAASEVGPTSGDFLGVHYPIVSWIDEIMTAERSIAKLWNECKLEGELFGTNDRAWKFWRQVELAESLGREEWLEIFYLCVAHGFTGNLQDEPEKLKNWLHRTRLRIGAVPELKLPFQSDLVPSPDVPPLYGRRAFERMMMVAWAASVVLLPMLSYMLVKRWVS